MLWLGKQKLLEHYVLPSCFHLDCLPSIVLHHVGHCRGQKQWATLCRIFFSIWFVLHNGGHPTSCTVQKRLVPWLCNKIKLEYPPNNNEVVLSYFFHLNTDYISRQVHSAAFEKRLGHFSWQHVTSFTS